MSTEKTYFWPFDLQEIKLDNYGKSGVYLIKNKYNGKCYIGSAVSKTSRHNRLFIRFKNHFFNTEKSTNKPLRRAIKKYGKSGFTFNILRYTGIDETRDFENYYIRLYKPEYNILDFADSSQGYKHTQATKEKIKLGYSQERKKSIGLLNKGKTLSDSTKMKLKLGAKERFKNPEFKKKWLKSVKKSENVRSKATEVYCGDTNELIRTFPSAKKAAIGMKCDYRTLRRHIKSGTLIKKQNIIVKYKLNRNF